MADRNEKYRQKYLAAVSKHLGEPAEQVGMFTQPGGMGSALTAQMSPLAGTLMRREGRKKTGGMPMNVIIGLTADQVHVFSFKPKGTSIKLKDTVVTWPRAQVRVEPAGDGTLANRFRFHLPDGETIELDSNKMPGASDFNQPLVEALS